MTNLETKVVDAIKDLLEMFVDARTIESKTLIDNASEYGLNTKQVRAILVTLQEKGGTTEFEYKESKLSTKVYASDLVTIGENSVIPDGVKIGINTAISGVTTKEDYTDGSYLDSGDYIVVKEGASK